MHQRIAVSLTALALVAASGFTTAANSPPVTLAATPTRQTPATQTAAAGPAATPVPQATTESCPGLESSVTVQLGDDFADILHSIAEHLESGRPAIEIPDRFSGEGDPDIIYDDLDVGVIIQNVTGRGSQDVVVTIGRGPSLFGGSSGAFVFRKCSSGKYTIHYISIDPEDQHRVDASSVRVIPARMLPNGLTQLIVVYGNVVSGRCLREAYLVVGMEEGTWRTYLLDGVGCDLRDVTFVSRVIVLDADPNGRRGLMLSGERWTGWGIYRFASRPVRVYYRWDGDGLVFDRRVLRPSIYRFHVLEDAQSALDQSNLSLALESYRRAATDLSLRNKLSLYEWERTGVNVDQAVFAQATLIARQYQTAFAHFRVLALSADTASPIRLQSMVDVLVLRYPEGQPGHEFAELAVIFQDEFVRSADQSVACQAVNAAVERDYPNLTGLEGHVGNWGDEGEFTIDVICPEL